MAEQRYRVIDRLEAGGMAEVFRGEALSVQGFKKQVAIKRVLPHLAQNKSFIRMFIDEARLGARLNHANIVTVFDIGAADNTFFIVMEFVDGANLKHVLESLKKQNKRPSVKEVLYIGMEICKGLSHAHGLTDDSGKLLNIVHRDISPPNILITKNGEVKVTDFGLAKATTQLEKTDPGVVKGKFSYLSPEAALGQEVDARTDVFAVGILMWEALAGRRLFLGDTDYETVKKVQRAEVPSLHELNPEVDAELEALFAKAMAKQRDERFQTAHDLGEAIADYLFRHRLRVTSFDIARLMQSVVVSKDDKRRKMDSSIIDQLISDELLAFTSLDDMSDPLNSTAAKAQSPDRPSVPRPAAGARPLDAGSFGRGEDPTAWYPDEDAPDEATSFFDRATLESGDFKAGRSDPHELAALLESDETGRNKVLAPADLGKLVESEAGEADKGGAALDDLISQRKPSPVTPGPAPVKVEQPKSGAAMYIVITFVVLGVLGAAAWFGGFIPH
ncbi:MAG TPA: serine/threonine-protein kinase [Polyangiales bacterium]